MARVTTRTLIAVALAGVLACAAAALGARQLVNHQTVRAAQRGQDAQQLAGSLLAQESTAGSLQAGQGALAAAQWRRAGAPFSAALARSRAAESGAPAALDALLVLGADARRWQTDVAAQLTATTGPAGAAGQTAAQRAALGDTRAALAKLNAAISAGNRSAVDSAEWFGAGLVALVAALVALCAAAVYRWLARRDRRRSQRLAALRERIQVSASEAESRRLLLSHASLLAPGPVGGAVLSLVESEDRLEPTLGEHVADTPLRAMALGRLDAGACLAVRLARGHRAPPPGSELGAETEAINPCAVCGRLPGAITCEPIRFSGRTLGSLLVASDRSLSEDADEELREAIAICAPVLALQRTLDVTSRRSAVDPLTDLPNRLAAEDAMRRLSAQAGRTVEPLAAVLIDLDHFRDVNDRFGYALGDAALQVVGKVLAAHVRASDFLARYGGEEFLVLAPSTDRTGAVELAEKLRLAVERTEMQVIGRVTASFGVAALPEDALEPATLLREADRAVYVAKSLGRNRVQEADSTAASEG
jgi:diguanylate cyclase (GGDEF)-like protein